MQAIRKKVSNSERRHLLLTAVSKMCEKTAALYLRISDADEDKNQKESNSISSQRDILKAYIRKHPELAGYRLLEFCDDGYSGTNFHRPQIKRLLEVVREGTISCILVKDFSRLGRNYIEVGTYLEQVFPFLGIRFISVNDGFDSAFSAVNGSGFLGTAFQTLVCDLYSRDLSEKIITARHTRADQGKFFTAYAPYGYRKTQEQKLAVDEDTAPIVQKIFELAIKGVSQTQIARILNLEEIPSPLMIRKQRGEHFPCRTSREKCVWRTSSVSVILKDQRYIGDAVYGKERPACVGSKKSKPVPKGEWVVVSNQHEALISRELFWNVQEIFAEKSSKMHQQAATFVMNHKIDERAPLSGIVRCGACNHSISRKKHVRTKNRETASYRCSTSAVTEEFGCYFKSIEEHQIEQAILQLLLKMSAVTINKELEQKIMQSQKKRIPALKKQVNDITAIQQKLESKRLQKYEFYKDGLIDKCEFLKTKRQTEVELERLFTQKKNLLEKINQVQEKMEQWNWKMPMQRRNDQFAVLTQEIVKAFVEQIIIMQDGSLKIKWKFGDVFLDKEH